MVVATHVLKETAMKSKALKEREFQHFRKMLEDDPELKQIVESAAESAIHGKQRSLRIPYISAPRLKEPAWKP